jgi:exodeoxyribonuclease VII large subunit
MSRRVTHDGASTLQVRFPFDRGLVDLVKTLPDRRWNPAEKFWSIPDLAVVELVDLLLNKGFSFDQATRDIYYQMGGIAEIGKPLTSAPGPQLPGLFDTPSEAPQQTGDPTDYTVSKLNEKVRQVIESTFPVPIWVVGEISGFNKSAHRKHVTFELAEREPSGATTSKIPATLFQTTRREIEKALKEAGDPFQLEDEISVRMLVRVELYVPWGQYRVVIEQLDVNYTLGEAARRREEIVRALTEAGLIGVNSQLPMPPLPLRVALITSLNSDAYNDILRTFQESGYAFNITAHGARVQGHATQPSVLNALDWIKERVDKFDVVMICRGGGSRTDLIWFDSEKLGKTVALFPIPVIVGIGHEQDLSVLDSVGRSCKTPTAAASFLVETVRESEERIETLRVDILENAARHIEEQGRQADEMARRLVLASRSLLQTETTALDHRRHRTVMAVRSLLSAAKATIARWASLIPMHTTLSLEKQKHFLTTTLRTIRPAILRLLHMEQERVDTRERRLRLLNPRRVVERGYSILRSEEGKVLTDVGMAPAGSLVRAELKSGELSLRSEGEWAKRKRR